MKKIIASILAVFFVLLSPLSAFASTTESMMFYSFSDDEYAVMPLASVDSGITLQTGAGYYDLASDEWFFSNIKTVSNPFKTFSTWPELYFTSSKSTYVAGYYTISGSGMPSVGDSWRIVCDNYRLAMYLDVDGTEKYISMTDNAVPFISEVEIFYSGTVRNVGGNTYTSASTSEVIPFSSIFNGTGVNSWNKSGDITLSFSMPSKNYFRTDSYGNVFEYEWVSANIDSITFRTCYAINNANYNLSNAAYIVGDLVRSQFGWDMTKIYIIETEGTLSNESSVISAGLQSVNTSINNLGSSMSSQFTKVTNNINQVKTQLTQSTNTITTKIDTMSQDIQTGLSNVVESAKQNTQNIINTVTQKVDEVKTGITEVKDSILDLPNKIQEMLLGLIVPDSDTMAAKYSEFSGLLEEKLGVIYQIPMMLFDFFDTIVNAATTPQTSLTLPAFRLPWIDGSQLTIWNSMEYDIMPEGLQVLSDLIQVVTSMTCVVLTFDTVRRFYNNFFSGGGPAI